ncbi:PTS system mannose/fructose/sorbose family transporter subunit IID [uncultured Olegusella sp.]|uniref:PTS system mannose/fructose/sorbose family transporter subunit IID n=1 Tax=uncultured Olegusella sp. TaxID=1979846 RepID=UPI002621F770|nr:PTS system mannose/fructose/sorbose family transporter subunit IID [uncultured Olegusella sp.]
MAEKIILSKKDRLDVMWRHQFLQGSWNYERMQNGGWCFSMVPAIKRLYSSKEEQSAALKRHMEFYNTHPYVSAPVIGVTLALEQDRANGTPIDDATIQGVKVGMMGPLAGVGDPVFWFTVRPILGALGASMAVSGNPVGPLLFFVAWNLIRLAFLWYTQELGYNLGTEITKDLSGGVLGRITNIASILGMFVIGALVERWVSITFTPTVSTLEKVAPDKFEASYPNLIALSQGIAGGQVTPDQLAAGVADANSALSVGSVQAVDGGYHVVATATLQDQLNSLIPGLVAVLLTLGCAKLLKKGVSPIVIILALFVVGIVFHVIGLM